MNPSDYNLDYQNQNTESKIIVSLEKIAQAFRVLLWQQSKEFSISPIQIQILIFLLFHSEEKRKVSYLAKEFNLTKATISEAIKTLARKGYVQKTPDEKDTRSYILHLTSDGQDIAEKASMFTKEIQTPVYQMPRDEKESMLLNLFEIIRHLNRNGVITIPRMCMTCTYYELSEDGGKHFCHLLNQELYAADLRIDCPEHVLKE